MTDASKLQQRRLWGKTPASQQRRQEIIVAAKSIFLADGYTRASMDHIATEAGTTKRTLYDHFGSKEALFRDCIDFCCEEFQAWIPRADDLDRAEDTRQALTYFVERLTLFVSTPTSVRFLRMVIAEAERHPAFARQLNDSSLVPAERVLRNYLGRQIARSALRPHDTASWAKILAGLATNFDYIRALLAIPGDEQQVAGAEGGLVVGLFVSTYGLENDLANAAR